MINAFVLYGTPETPNLDVFHLGIQFLDLLAVDCQEFHLNKLNRLGYRVTKKIAKNELIELFGKESFNYEISYNERGQLFYFSQSVRSVGAFNTIKFGGFSDSALSMDARLDYARQILNCVPCRYGFYYQATNAFKAINYAHDVGITAVRSYDASMKWQRKFTYSKDDEEFSSHFRVVYELNYLTRQHLARSIDGLPLSTWIAADRRRGDIIPVNEDIWLWRVAPESLDEVNAACGAAGLLVSFTETKKSAAFAYGRTTS